MSVRTLYLNAMLFCYDLIITKFNFSFIHYHIFISAYFTSFKNAQNTYYILHIRMYRKLYLELYFERVDLLLFSNLTSKYNTLQTCVEVSKVRLQHPVFKSYLVFFFMNLSYING